MPLSRTSFASALFLAVASCWVAFGSAGPGAQENPNRPPWAQKTKAKSAASKVPEPAPGSRDDSGTIVAPNPPAPEDSSEQAASQRGRIRVSVNLVNVLVSVLDEHNRPAADLPKEAFELLEEGVRQKIDVFEPETSQPLDLVLMIDSSLSARKEISFEQDAAAHFIRQVIRPGDRLAVYAFDQEITQMAGFSDSISTLQAAVRKIPPGAGTSIYDAVLLGSRALERRGEERRRVIILVTDGGETTSRADFDAARKGAVRSGTLLYTILVRPVKSESGRNTAGEHALQTITDTTGGAIFFPDSPEELTAIFDRIDRELRTQYRLAYYPNPHGPASTYRSIEVRVGSPGNSPPDPAGSNPAGPLYQVRHRKSYLTGPT